MGAKITDRFQAAGVPRSCWGVKLAATGRDNINQWAKDLKTRADQHEGLLSAYVHLPPEGDGKSVEGFVKGQETVELLARQAVVEGHSVKLVLFHHLIHSLEKGAIEYRDDDVDTRRRASVLELLGSGVIAVPYVPTPDESHATAFQYRTALDFLLTHVYEGGAVIVGGTQRLTKKLQSRYPRSFERILVQNSEIFGV
jgi:hypothetical protein